MSAITMVMVPVDGSVLVSIFQKASIHKHTVRFTRYVAVTAFIHLNSPLRCFFHPNNSSGLFFAEQVLSPNDPGIHLAERNLFIGVAKLLWAFHFSVKRGEEINTSAETGLSQGFLHCVKEYGSSITLRSEARRDTIFSEFEEAKTTFARFE